MTSHAEPLPVAAIAALNRGNKIEAIKIVRRERGIALKAAKDVVEEYLRSQPALAASFARKQADAIRSALRWLIFVVVVGVLAYFYFAAR